MGAICAKEGLGPVRGCLDDSATLTEGLEGGFTASLEDETALLHAYRGVLKLRRVQFVVLYA